MGECAKLLPAMDSMDASNEVKASTKVATEEDTKAFKLLEFSPARLLF